MTASKCLQLKQLRSQRHPLRQIKNNFNVFFFTFVLLVVCCKSENERTSRASKNYFLLFLFFIGCNFLSTISSARSHFLSKILMIADTDIYEQIWWTFGIKSFCSKCILKFSIHFRALHIPTFLNKIDDCNHRYLQKIYNFKTR